MDSQSHNEKRKSSFFVWEGRVDRNLGTFQQCLVVSFVSLGNYAFIISVCPSVCMNPLNCVKN